MKNIAVFISGAGTNLQALIDWEKQGKLLAKIALVISNKSDAYGIIRAKEAGIRTVVLNHKDYATREDHEKAIENQLTENHIDLIILVGYMRLFTADFVKRWYLKIINLHPALLPSFPGIKVIERTFDYGVKWSGVSTIFVDEGMDSGIIILQDIVKIQSNETLETLTEKIQNLEHKLLPETVNLVASEKYTIEGRKVILKDQSMTVNGLYKKKQIC